MKILPLLLLYLLITIAAVGQQPEYPDSGFTNKAEAKNLMINGKKEGKWVEYFDRGVDVIVFLPDSNKACCYSLTVYNNAKPLGIKREYTIKGVLTKKTPYIDGRKNGVEKEYDIMIETPYVNDTINGIEIYYYENGMIASQITYVKGTETARKNYYRSGKLQGEFITINGTTVRSKYYDVSGNEIKQ